MKHPTHCVSRRLQKVSRGRRALSRKVEEATKKLRDDPSFRKLVGEITRQLIELLIRITIIQCMRPGRELAQVVPFRPKPVS
jgi:hypothetical protein